MRLNIKIVPMTDLLVNGLKQLLLLFSFLNHISGEIIQNPTLDRNKLLI